MEKARNGMTVSELLAEVPEHSIVLQVTFQESVPPSVWVIFPDPVSADEFVARHHMTWVSAEACSSRLDYVQRWADARGWGVELTQYQGSGTQLARVRRRPQHTNPCTFPGCRAWYDPGTADVVDGLGGRLTGWRYAPGEEDNARIHNHRLGGHVQVRS